MTRLAPRLNGWLRQSPWGDAIQLARRLSAGTDSAARGRPPRRGLPDQRALPLHDRRRRARRGPAARLPVQDPRRVLPALRRRRHAAAAAGRRPDPRRQRLRDRQAHRREHVRRARRGRARVDRGLLPGLRLGPVQPDARRAPRPTSRPRPTCSPRSRRRAAIGAGAPARRRWPARGARRSPRRSGACAGAVPRIALGELLARLTPEPVAPSTTLTALRPRLAAIGPSVAALADQAERARFAADGTSEPPHPYLRVWRALARDLGAWRATRSLLRAAR